MPPGRPRKPKEVKLLEGTYRPNRDPGDRLQYSLLAEIPNPPEELSKYGKTAVNEWYFICGELQAANMLQATDLFLISAYCIEMATYFKCVRLLKSTLTYMTKNGPRKRPEVSIKNDSLKAAMQIASKLGFSPTDREKLTSPKKPEPSDVIANLLT